MAWLEDQAKECGHASLRATAVAMHGSSLWPAGDRRSVETIANKLRHADQGVDVRWWNGKGKALLPALAEVLGEDQHDLLERLLHTAAAAGDAAADLWPFKLFPELRAINLRTESLFPGIPPEIARDGGPRGLRTWWVAPPGAGKTLVGRWLAARYGWTFHTVARLPDFQVPDNGRLFIELGSVEGVTVDLLKALPKDTRICIATARSPVLTPQATPSPRESPGMTSSVPLPSWSGPPLPSPWGWMAGFHVVEPPPPGTWVSALIGWVTARVTPGGGFDGARAQQLFRTGPLASLFATPGELLGFLGMMDAIGLEQIESVQREPQRWIRVWLKAVMDRTDRRPAAAIVDVLRTRGDEILVHAEIERFRRGLPPALPLHAWAELLPPQPAPTLDPDRVRDLLNGDANEALKQLRAMLHPEPMSIAEGLRAAGVLDDVGDDRLVMRPAWVANTLGNLAFNTLYRRVPDGIGALLLLPGSSEFVVDQLTAEIQAGSLDCVAACAEATDLCSPEHAAALDGAFRATGLAVLAGAKVPTELLVRLWDRQMSCVAQRFTNWPPQPVLAVASSDPWRGVATIGAWFLAALAISHALCDAGVALPCSALNPWAVLPDAGDELGRCLEALSAIAMVFGPVPDAARRDPRQLAVHRLGGDLLDRHGILRRSSHLLDLQTPDILVELARGKPLALSDQERAHLLELPFGLQALEAACGRRQVALDDVLTWCWTRWTAPSAMDLLRTLPPPLSWLSRGESGASLDDAKRLWSIAPAAALSAALYQTIADRTEIWAWIPVPFWTHWLERWSAEPGRWAHSAQPFSWLPHDLAVHALRTGAIHAPCHDVRARLWERMPDALIALIDELSALPSPPPGNLDSPGTVSDIVWSTPPQHHAMMVERARRWIASPARYPAIGSWLRPWLMHVVQQRSTGWQDAYSTLIGWLAEPKRDTAHPPNPESERPANPPA